MMEKKLGGWQRETNPAGVNHNEPSLSENSAEFSEEIFTGWNRMRQELDQLWKSFEAVRRQMMTFQEKISPQKRYDFQSKLNLPGIKRADTGAGNPSHNVQMILLQLEDLRKTLHDAMMTADVLANLEAREVRENREKFTCANELIRSLEKNLRDLKLKSSLEVANARDELKKWREQTEALTRRTSMSDSERRGYEEKLRSLKIHNEELEAEVKKISEESSDWQQQVGGLIKRIEQLEMHRREAEDRRLSIELEKDNLRKTLDEKKNELQKAVDENRRLQGDFESELAKSCDEVASWREQSRKLMVRLDQMETSQKGYAEEKALFESEKNKLKDALQAKQQEYDKAIEGMKRLEAELAEGVARWEWLSLDSKNQIEILKKQLSDAEAYRRIMDERRTVLESEKKELETILDTQQGEYRKVIENGQRLRAALDEALAKSRQEASSWQSRVDPLKQQLEASEARRREIDARLTVRDSEKKELDAALQALNEEYRKSILHDKDLRHSLEASLIRTQHETEGWKVQVDDLRLRFEQAEALRRDLEAKKALVENEKRNLEASLQTKETEYQKAVEENARLRGELDKAYAEIALLKNQVQDLMIKLDIAETAKRAVVETQIALEREKADLVKALETMHMEYQTANQETVRIRRELGISLAKMQEQSGNWQDEAAELKKQLEVIETQKLEVESKMTVSELRKLELEKMLCEKHDEYERRMSESVRTRHALEAELGKVRHEIQGWILGVDQYRTENHVLLLEKQKLIEFLNIERKRAEEWGGKYSEMLFELNSLQQQALHTEKAKHVSSQDNADRILVYENEIRRLKEVCQDLENELMKARQVFVERLTACAEEIEHWKGKASQKAEPPKKAAPDELPASQSQPKPAETAEPRKDPQEQKQPVSEDAWKDKLQLKRETPEEKPAPVVYQETDRNSNIFELRRFQELIEGHDSNSAKPD